MASAMATPTCGGTGAGDGQNRATEVDDQIKKVERWKTMFKVVGQIESLELRAEFSRIVESDEEEKCRVCAFS